MKVKLFIPDLLYRELLSNEEIYGSCYRGSTTIISSDLLGWTFPHGAWADVNRAFMTCCSRIRKIKVGAHEFVV